MRKIRFEARLGGRRCIDVAVSAIIIATLLGRTMSDREKKFKRKVCFYRRLYRVASTLFRLQPNRIRKCELISLEADTFK